jgi:dTDP-4-dehydrorhamnose reductase
MKKILITGSNGLIGQKLVERCLLEKDYEIIATSFSDNVIHGKDGYQFELMDITNPVEVDYILNRYEPEVVIHTAAATQVALCETQQLEAWKTNVEATGILAESSERLGSQFILLSSDFVFDGRKGPYSEENKPQPVNYYGKTKLESEKIAAKISSNLAIIRTCLVYGTNFTMRRSNFILWVKYCLEKNGHIRVNNDQWRTPTLAEDIAEACLSIVGKEAKGIFHIAGAENMRVLELAYAIADFYKLDKDLITEVSSEELEEIGLRPLKSGLIIDKAAAELDFQPHTIVEGLKIVTKQLKSMESIDD